LKPSSSTVTPSLTPSAAPVDSNTVSQTTIIASAVGGSVGLIIIVGIIILCIAIRPDEKEKPIEMQKLNTDNVEMMNNPIKKGVDAAPPATKKGGIFSWLTSSEPEYPTDLNTGLRSAPRPSEITLKQSKTVNLSSRNQSSAPVSPTQAKVEAKKTLNSDDGLLVPSTAANRPLADLSAEEVLKVLSGLSLTRFQDSFRENGINGSIMSQFTTVDELKDCGLPMSGPVARAFLKEIAKFRANGVPSSLLR